MPMLSQTIHQRPHSRGANIRGHEIVGAGSTNNVAREYVDRVGRELLANGRKVVQERRKRGFQDSLLWKKRHAVRSERRHEERAIEVPVGDFARRFWSEHA